MRPAPILVACLALVAAAPPMSPIEPAAAVAMADAGRTGQSARFVMTVAQVGRVNGSAFLNSQPDYRAPDDLSFQLKPNVVKALERRFGQPVEMLVGKRVVVNGTVRRTVIVNETASFHRGQTFNRWQHLVPILFEHQIVSIG